jgi:hypothetical protein
MVGTSLTLGKKYMMANELQFPGILNVGWKEKRIPWGTVSGSFAGR